MIANLVRGTSPATADFSVGAAPSPNILNLAFTGLGCDPNGDADGQRPQCEEFAALYGSDFAIWSWSRDGWSLANAIKECDELYDVIHAGNGRGAYTHLLMSGHSFGGSFLHFFIEWLTKWHPEIKINLARFLDPVPNPYDFNPWTLPMVSVMRALQWTQSNGMGPFLQVFGPNGKPLSPDGAGVIEGVAFPGEFWPTINHVSLVVDKRVWGPSLVAMQEAVTPDAPTPAV